MRTPDAIRAKRYRDRRKMSVIIVLSGEDIDLLQKRGYEVGDKVSIGQAVSALHNLTGSKPAECKVQQQTMNPWDEIPRRVRPSFALRSKRVNVISPSFRELHRGQRSWRRTQRPYI
jgi:hypothetical protein